MILMAVSAHLKFAGVWWSMDDAVFDIDFCFVVYDSLASQNQLKNQIISKFECNF